MLAQKMQLYALLHVIVYYSAVRIHFQPVQSFSFNLMEFSPEEMKPNARWNGVEVREAADMMDADRIINQSGGEGTQIYDHQTQLS